MLCYAFMMYILLVLDASNDASASEDAYEQLLGRVAMPKVRRYRVLTPIRMRLLGIL